MLSGDLERITWALKLGVNPTLSGGACSSPLGILVNQPIKNPQFFDIAQILIKTINHFSGKNLCLYQINANGHTLLDLAILSGDETNVEKVLTMGFDIQHVYRSTGKSPFTIFFTTQPLNYKIARLLVQYGASPHAIDAKGNNLLELAIATGDKTLIGQALDLGINPKEKKADKLSAIEQALTKFPNDSSIAFFIRDYQPNLVEVISSPAAPQQAACSSTSTQGPAKSASRLLIEIDNLFYKEEPGLSIYDFLVTQELDKDSLKYLGNKPSAKRAVFNYISDCKDLHSKLEMIKNAMDESTQLGAFFWVKRGYFSKPSLEKGYLAKLGILRVAVLAAIDEEIEKEKQAQVPSSSYTSIGELIGSAPPESEPEPEQPICSSNPGLYPAIEEIKLLPQQRPEQETKEEEPAPTTASDQPTHF